LKSGFCSGTYYFDIGFNARHHSTYLRFFVLFSEIANNSLFGLCGFNMPPNRSCPLVAFTSLPQFSPAASCSSVWSADFLSAGPVPTLYRFLDVKQFTYSPYDLTTRESARKDESGCIPALPTPKCAYRFMANECPAGWRPMSKGIDSSTTTEYCCPE
jgi:hypothetical protein